MCFFCQRSSRSLHWSTLSIVSLYQRHYCLQFKAIEIRFVDRTTLLISLTDEIAAGEMYKCLVKKIFRSDAKTLSRRGSSFRNASVQGLPLRALALRPHELIQQPVHREDMGFGRMAINPRTLAAAPLLTLTQAWQRREISTYAYLMHLNTAAGRSLLTLSQYPVFPWVLSDYSSKKLNLKDPASYRDFRYPMGAQTEEQRYACDARYAEGEASWESDPEDGFRPFHSGSHYSCAAFVLWYLVRLAPYTALHKKLQVIPTLLAFVHNQSPRPSHVYSSLSLTLYSLCVQPVSFHSRVDILIIPIAYLHPFKPPITPAATTAPTSKNSSQNFSPVQKCSKM